MQTLTIPIPEGYEIDSLDKSSGEVKLKEKPKSIIERIKTIDDVLKENGMTQQDLDKQFKRVPDHLKWQYVAELLCEILNDGWVADWDDSSQPKYFPWWKMGSSGFRFHANDGWNTISSVGSRLCLKSRELVNHVGEHFPELHKKFMILN